MATRAAKGKGDKRKTPTDLRLSGFDGRRVALILQRQNRDNAQFTKAVKPAVCDGGIGPHALEDDEVTLLHVGCQGHFARQTIYRIAGGAKDHAALNFTHAALTVLVHHLDAVDDADLAEFKHRPIDAIVQKDMLIIAHRFDAGCDSKSIAAQAAARFADQGRTVCAKAFSRHTVNRLEDRVQINAFPVNTVAWKTPAHVQAGNLHTRIARTHRRFADIRRPSFRIGALRAGVEGD